MEIDETQNLYWKQTKKLAISAIAISCLACIAVVTSNFLPQASLFGFPITFYLAAQGIILVFIAIAFSFVIRQERLDQKYRVSEDI